MKIQNGKDFWAGVMFMGVGAAFMFVARDYQMGSAVRMGPAYFPMVLGGLQIVLGAMIFMRGYFSKLSHTVWVFPFRPWFFFPGLVLGLFAFNAADWIKTLGSPGEVIQYIINAASLFLMRGMGARCGMPPSQACSSRREVSRILALVARSTLICFKKSARSACSSGVQAAR